MTDDAVPDNPKLRALAEGVRDVANAAGAKVPELVANEAFVVNLNWPIQKLAPRVADHLRSGRFGLYRRGPDIGTINGASGEWEKMDAHRFRVWLPRMCQVVLKAKEMADGSIMEGELELRQSEGILRCDDLRTLLPEVERIHSIKMPVYRDELDERDNPQRKGFRRVELLKQGYDAASKTFTTVGGLDFPEDMDIEEAVEFWATLLKYFEFGLGGGAGVQMASMLTAFARLLFEGRPPMFLWNANQVGSGKSRLAKLPLWAVYGHADGAMSDVEQRDKFREELNSSAQVFAPYILFDDVDIGGRTFRSSDLNRWLTSESWSCRVLGGSAQFRGLLYAMTFMTANRLKLTPDLQRRTLVCDIFSHVKSDDRVLPGDVVMLDDKFFKSEENRKKVLASMWAIVREWDQRHRPGLAKGVKSLASFEGWSEIIAPMVTMFGWPSPLTKFDAPDVGDTTTRQFEKLIRLVIREFGKPDVATAVSLRQIVGVARRHELFSDLWPRGLGTIEDVRGTKSDKGGFRPVDIKDSDAMDREPTEDEEKLQASEWVNPSIRSGWGKKLKANFADGRYFLDDAGESWALGDRGNNDAASYQLRRIPAK